MPFLGNFINISATARIMSDPTPEEVTARFEELSVLESEFEDVEAELSMPTPNCSFTS